MRRISFSDFLRSGSPTLTPRRWFWIALSGFAALAALLVGPVLTHLPEGIHSWAQADRLALALAFYDHGLDLSRPRTLNLSSVGGVVGVEFPLQAWLAAAAGKVLGRAAIPALFRCLTAAALVLAAAHLARHTYERSRQWAASLVPGAFLFASPVAAYYSSNFQPDAFSMSLVLIGYCYYLRYHEPAEPAERRYVHLVVGVLLLLTATLVKTTAGAYLGAALLLTGLWSYVVEPLALSRAQKLGLLAVAAGTVVSVGGYVVFNRWLNSAFQSDLFLAAAKPIETAAQWAYVQQRIREVWQVEYFLAIQYDMLKVSCIVLAVSSWWVLRRRLLVVLHLLLAAAGGVAFVKLLGLQLIDHDYYVLAPLWPGLTLFVGLAIEQVALALSRLPPWGRWIQVAGWSALVVVLLVRAWPHHRSRQSDTYLPFSAYYDYQWLRGGAAELARAGVPRTATVLVLEQNPPNTALVYFDRYGLSLPRDATTHATPSDTAPN